MEKVYQGDRVEIFRVTPHVYFRKANLIERSQCNGAFLVGEHGVAVVDVPTVEAAHELMDESLRLFGKPIHHIFLTHGHEDHVDGLPPFLDRDVTIFCSRRLLRRVVPGAGCRAAFAGVDALTTVHLPGGPEVELFTPPEAAHSPWDMFVRVPADRLICTGDAAVEFQTLYYHNADVEGWIHSLRWLAERNDSYVLPGHGDLYRYSHIGEVADFLSLVLAAARQCFARYPAGQIRHITADQVCSDVSAYFREGGAEARAIVGKAGGDAEREVRMVLWHLIREQMR